MMKFWLPVTPDVSDPWCLVFVPVIHLGLQHDTSHRVVSDLASCSCLLVCDLVCLQAALEQRLSVDPSGQVMQLSMCCPWKVRSESQQAVTTVAWLQLLTQVSVS
jgi:hypothetical protein